VTWLEDLLNSKWPGFFTALGPPLVPTHPRNTQPHPHTVLTGLYPRPRPHPSTDTISWLPN